MLENIKAVLFDLDGTLIDSMGIWGDIDVLYMEKHKCVMPASLQKDIEGLSMRETAQYFQEKFGITDSEEDMMAEWNEMAYDFYANKIPFKKGALEFLTYLKENGIKTGICTSNSMPLVDAISNHLGLQQYIDCFMSANEVEHGKPHPDIYLAVAKRLGVLPENCLVFEDIIPGIQAGLNAGMKVCAVYDNYSKDCDEKKRELAHYYINDFTQIKVE